MLRIMSLVVLLFLALTAVAAEPPVYVLLWFDTEDYITPQDDDACLRLAKDLSARSVPATFKIVAEKARVLKQRKRFDVIRAMKAHDIAYHSENHSIPPAPAVYLRPLGMQEGADEFVRREGPGAKDVMRIFGAKSLSTYGQPGSSWGPQSHAALVRMKIPTYIDEGRHVGIDNRPFWFGGLLWIFNLGPYAIRMDINDESKLEATVANATVRAKALQQSGGGVMHFWYHPNEFVTTEFWDGVNFSRGASPAREDWKPAKLRTPEDSERCYRILNNYVDRLKAIPGVRFVTARQVLDLFEKPTAPVGKPEGAKAMLRESINWHDKWSAADLLATALSVPRTSVGAPIARRESTVKTATIPRRQFDRAVKTAIETIRAENRLPVEIWIDSETLSIGDFAATFVRDDGRSPQVAVHRGALDFEKHVATDACRNFNWVIHPEGFCAPELYALARVEAWTLKPAKMRLQ